MRSGGSSKTERPQERTLELHWRLLFAVHIDRSRLMSALGQKQTCAVRNAMSALPPIADMRSAQADAR